jgi:hypothetical protein
MFAISWTEAGSVVTECHETVDSAIARVNEAVVCKNENLLITEIATGRPVTVNLLRQIDGTDLIGQRVYQARVRAGLHRHLTS